MVLVQLDHSKTHSTLYLYLSHLTNEGIKPENHCPGFILRWSNKKDFCFGPLKGQPTRPTWQYRQATHYLLTKRHVSLFKKEQCRRLVGRLIERKREMMVHHTSLSNAMWMGNPTCPTFNWSCSLLLFSFTSCGFQLAHESLIILHLYMLHFPFLFTWVFHHFQLKPMSFLSMWGFLSFFFFFFIEVIQNQILHHNYKQKLLSVVAGLVSFFFSFSLFSSGEVKQWGQA